MDAVKNALGRLLLIAPFFGAVGLRLKLEETEAVKTAATDGVSLLFNPHFVAQLSRRELVFLVAHEIAHVVLKHMLRRGARDHKRWNKACDYAINIMLDDSNYFGDFPQDGLLDARYRGMSSEAIYAVEQRQESEQQQQEQGDGQSGDESDDQSGQSDDQSGDQSDDGSGDQDGDDDGQTFGPGDVPTFEEALAEGLGDVIDAENPEEVEAEVEQAITMAAATAMRAGNMPGGIVAQLDGRNDPNVDWSEELDYIMSGQGNDFVQSWARPNRRMLEHGYFPGNERIGFDHLVIAVDTSGSMSDEWVKQSVSETLAIAEKFGPRVTFIPCDSKIHNPQDFEPNDYPEEVSGFEIAGRGGTELHPVFKYLEDQGEEPDMLIFFTDGLVGRWPDEPEYPVVWGMTTEITPPWGQSVRVT